MRMTRDAASGVKTIRLKNGNVMNTSGGAVDYTMLSGPILCKPVLNELMEASAFILASKTA
jgi:hypothetical protein